MFWLYFCQGLTDTKISSSSRFNPMSVLRVPHQTDLTQAYSQHCLHRSVSRLIDGKSLKEEENWDNPTGHDSGLVSEEEVIFPKVCACFNHFTGCLPVCGRRACGCFKNLKHCKKGAHHVHGHTPLGQDGVCSQVSQLTSGYKPDKHENMMFYRRQYHHP